MAISFLHVADIHLDSPLRGLERYEHAPVERIRGATRRAFERMIDLAVDRRVDFVLIAGDLYDGDWRDYNTGLYLTRQLGRLRDAAIPVVVIAGNHDAANKMTRALRLPDNVHLLAHDRPETVRLDELGVAVHGQSFARAAVTENLVAGYPAALTGCVNVGLLHTCLAGAEGHERYAPCTIEDLRGKGYDYWALGHIHARHAPCVDPPVVFAGNIQGRHIRETGAKGCLLATVHPGDGVAQEFHRLDLVRWERGRVDVADLDAEAGLLDRVAETLDTLLRSETDSVRLLVVRVVLHGASALHDRLHADPERYVAEVRNLAQDRGGDRLWIEKVEFQTRPARAVVLHDGPIEEIEDVLGQLRDDPAALAELGEELADLRRRLPPELAHGLDAPHLGDPDWLRAILDRVQPLLFDLLLRSERTTVP
jgi:DNA repair exonuclease SbcCD nuclease subunit